MNIDEMINRVDEMISVMDAFRDGKKIQCKWIGIENEWNDINEPFWDWYHYEYRIKPEEVKSKTIYVNEYESGLRVVFDNEDDANNATIPLAIRVAVKYQEVV